MDDIVKAFSRTMADRFDTSKKFRLIEKHIRNVFELLMICVQGELKNVKQILGGIAKDSMKLNSATSILLHLKSHMGPGAIS